MLADNWIAVHSIPDPGLSIQLFDALVWPELMLSDDSELSSAVNCVADFGALFKNPATPAQRFGNNCAQS